MKKIILISIIILLLLSLTGCIDIFSTSNKVSLAVAGDMAVNKQFILTVKLNPCEELGGWEIIEMSFSPDKAQVDSVTMGTSWMTEYHDTGDIDNVEGTITGVQSMKTEGYTDEETTLCKITFTAINSGTFDFEITEFMATNSQFEEMEVIPETSFGVTKKYVRFSDEISGPVSG